MLNEKFNELNNEELYNLDGGVAVSVLVFGGACVVAGIIGAVNGYCDASK